MHQSALLLFTDNGKTLGYMHQTRTITVITFND